MPDAPRQLPSPVGILDNRSRGAAGDFLRAHLKEGTELSVVSAYFTISAYEALKEELEQVERMRFLYGAPDHLRALGRDNRPARAFGLTEEGLAPTRQLSQRAVAKRCADWIRRKAEIPSVKDTSCTTGRPPRSRSIRCGELASNLSATLLTRAAQLPERSRCRLWRRGADSGCVVTRASVPSVFGFCYGTPSA